MVKKHVHYMNEKSHQMGELDFTYYSAVNTVKNALAKVKDEKRHETGGQIPERRRMS
jgi:excinuclease ABC subunit A